MSTVTSPTQYLAARGRVAEATRLLRRPSSSTARTNRMPIVSVPLNDPAERGDSVTRPIQQPGAPPGEFQRPRTPRPLFRRVRLETGENEPTYYWDTDGVLFHDSALTQATGLVIVALPDDDKNEDG